MSTLEDTHVKRIEKDFLGSKDVPSDAYYGVHTTRAMENFTVASVQINHFPLFIVVFAMVKKASLAANLEFKLLPTDKAQAIDLACDGISGSQHNTHHITKSATGL